MTPEQINSYIQLAFWAIFIIASLAQLPKVRAFIAAQVGEKRANQLQVLANTAVHMTEKQLGSVPGNEKKIVAVNAFKNLAEGQGLGDVTESELHAFIEAAVLFLPKELKLEVGQALTSNPAPVAPQETGQAAG